MLQELALIGGVRDYHGGRLAIHGAVQNTSGQRHDKAIVLVSKEPPYREYDPHTIHWADEIVSVTASPFALSCAVRTESAERAEISMGFAPVGIEKETGAGMGTTLGCATSFLNANSVKGEDTRLSEYQGPWQEQPARL